MAQVLISDSERFPVEPCRLLITAQSRRCLSQAINDSRQLGMLLAKRLAREREGLPAKRFGLG
jgi:hypothetical protein